MHEYKLTPAFFSQMQKRVLVFCVPLMMLAVVGGVWLGSRGVFSPGLIIAIPVMVVVSGFSIFNGLRQQQRLWSSYRLLIDESSLRRIQSGLPDTLIAKSEISKITEAEGGWLLVHSSSPARQIIIPATIENYLEVRSLLVNWCAIEGFSATKTKWFSFQPFVAGLLTLIASWITFFATNPYIVIGVGGALGVTLIISFMIIQRSKDITTQVKRNSWLIVFPLMAIVARVWFAIIISR